LIDDYSAIASVEQVQASSLEGVPHLNIVRETSLEEVFQGCKKQEYDPLGKSITSQMVLFEVNLFV
jgi:hypothetical protein